MIYINEFLKLKNEKKSIKKLKINNDPNKWVKHENNSDLLIYK